MWKSVSLRVPTVVRPPLVPWTFSMTLRGSMMGDSDEEIEAGRAADYGL
jgi:hypothetical protein